MGAEEIADDEWLLRRIPPYAEPQMDQNPPDGGDSRQRPPSSAFSLRGDEVGLSFHLELSLRASGEALTFGCPEGEPGWAITRISAGVVRALGLRIELDGPPHHVQVLGLADLPRSKRREIQRKLAQHSDYVVPPRAI